MFWTAVIYGAGVSLGSCVGLFVFVLIFGMLLKGDKSTNRKLAAESLEALKERNSLTREMITQLEYIAAAIGRE